MQALDLSLLSSCLLSCLRSLFSRSFSFLLVSITLLHSFPPPFLPPLFFTLGHWLCSLSFSVSFPFYSSVQPPFYIVFWLRPLLGFPAMSKSLTPAPFQTCLLRSSSATLSSLSSRKLVSSAWPPTASRPSLRSGRSPSSARTCAACARTASPSASTFVVASAGPLVFSVA